MKTQGQVWVLYDTEKKSQSKPMSVFDAQVLILSLNSSAAKKFLLWTPGWEKWQTVAEFLKSDQTYFAIVAPPTPAVAAAPAAEPTPAESTLKIDEASRTIALTPDTFTKSISEELFTQVFMGAAPTKHQEVGGYYFQDFNGDELDLQKVIDAKGLQNTLSFAPKASNPKKNDDRRQQPRHDFKIEVVLVSKVRSFRTYSKNISVSGTMLEDEVPKDFLGQHFDLILVNPFEPNKSKARLLFKAKIVGDLSDPRRLMFMEENPEMTFMLDALLKAYVTYQNQRKKKSVG